MKAGNNDTIEKSLAAMRAVHADPLAIENFRHHLEFLLAGKSAFLPEESISPVVTLPDSEDFGRYRTTGERLLKNTVVIKLNGGLGTGMGLDLPKSLIEVRQGMTFLDLIARQIGAMRRATGAAVPLLLMNSLGTRPSSLEHLEKYPEILVGNLPLDFLQNRVPKIDRETLKPVEYPRQPGLEWCPPGHGDLYTAITASGTLNQLLEQGITYAFVSNADNLGAVLSTEILGFMAETRTGFLMEVADRTKADRKGGHLCLSREGALTLRESAQCPPEDLDRFQDIDTHRFFNTNNLWIHLPTLLEVLARFGGVLPLPTILNGKTVDPQDPESPAVWQLETAMGSAIALFPGAAAVRVPRNRFSPVKGTGDLLAVRSNAYRLTSDFRIVQDPSRSAPPAISLDPEFFSMFRDFESRFPDGPPALLNCTSLTVTGPVTFGGNIDIEGTVDVTAEAPATLPGDRLYSGTLTLDDW